MAMIKSKIPQKSTMTFHQSIWLLYWAEGFPSRAATRPYERAQHRVRASSEATTRWRHDAGRVALQEVKGAKGRRVQPGRKQRGRAALAHCSRLRAARAATWPYERAQHRVHANSEVTSCKVAGRVALWRAALDSHDNLNTLDPHDGLNSGQPAQRPGRTSALNTECTESASSEATSRFGGPGASPHRDALDRHHHDSARDSRRHSGGRSAELRDKEMRRRRWKREAMARVEVMSVKARRPKPAQRPGRMNAVNTEGTEGCEAMLRNFGSPSPLARPLHGSSRGDADVGVDGDADGAGQVVEVEYGCSGVPGASGLVGGLGGVHWGSVDVHGCAASADVQRSLVWLLMWHCAGSLVEVVSAQGWGGRTLGMAPGP
ncbi:uncharacterized protein C8Q71DRAFT_720562 [Rhodofomes roseus]|uniref:Uncharacterized protein n=1 Tax=Rhodofomes roseus TaxID=34475 RepID=A0ABQ8KRX8_9APHY|nr:uncharacterized protein C8Q71DRAFT_720562 [Rhodofomes roseus]KAH9841334.1 hypothetical protein C8Q71DRAFT_720562 [Rhodofomes roseus]